MLPVILSFLFAAFSSINAFAPEYVKISTPTKFSTVQAKLSDDIVQGGSLKTWAFFSLTVECVQVVLKSDGRPLDANAEL